MLPPPSHNRASGVEVLANVVAESKLWLLMQDISSYCPNQSYTLACALGFGLSMLLVQSMDVHLFVGVPAPTAEYVIEENQQVLTVINKLVETNTITKSFL